MEVGVRKCFEDGVVFVSGGTGFLGKILIYKLLTHTLVKRIYILVRRKKGKTEDERYADIFAARIFESMKKDLPDYLSRVELITGDYTLPNAGVSDDDWTKLKNTVHFVFNCAATVRFNQHIRTAAYINVRSTMDLIKNVKEFKVLKALVHVSTAYANCPISNIDEEFYEAPLPPQKLIELVELLSDEQLEAITPTIIGEWPNSYTFTKCISEDVVRTEAAGLPTAIVRPSMILPAYREPLPGWVDNVYGPIGIVLASALGVLRASYCHRDLICDMVPVDYVVNAIMAAGAKTSLKPVQAQETATIYNYVSSMQNPLSWREYQDKIFKVGLPYASTKMIYKPMMFYTDKKWVFNIMWFLLHMLPAYIIDFICNCIGKKPQMVDNYVKLRQFAHLVEYFGEREWRFTNANTQLLLADLGEEDRRLFSFDFKGFDWEDYMETAIKGGRLYLINEPMDTLPAGRRMLKIYDMIHYSIVFTLSSILLYLLYVVIF